MNTFGERLLYLIEANNLSKASLARKINKSKPMISNYIDNLSEPTLSVLKELSKVFNVSIDYLVFGTEEYKDAIEEQLIDAFRKLNHDNKVVAVGEIMKLLTMQNLKDNI